MYICDLKVFDGLQCKEGWFCAAPICLLYVNKHDQLVPIAIQLMQKPGVDNPIFLPSDNLADWLLAKAYYQCVHGQVCLNFKAGDIAFKNHFYFSFTI